MHATRIVALLSLLIVAGCSRSAIQQPAVVATSSAPSTSSASLPSAASQASESSQQGPSEVVTAKPRIDACALLTSKEVQSVQGEKLQETKSAGQSAGGFSISQCFFTLPTFSNSISLMVAEKGAGPDAVEPEEFWRERFHEDREGDDGDRDREREKDIDRKRDKDKDRERVADKKRGEEEEEEAAPPQKIAGVGDEAYWVGNRIGGALYVLKGDAYLRISIGGPLNQPDKIRKSRMLARKALARL